MVLGMRHGSTFSLKVKGRVKGRTSLVTSLKKGMDTLDSVDHRTVIRAKTGTDTAFSKNKTFPVIFGRPHFVTRLSGYRLRLAFKELLLLLHIKKEMKTLV